MFNRSHLDRLHNSLSEFSLDKVCSTTNTDLPSLYHYLEFYGFLYTLKGLPVEYYCGYRKPAGDAGRWGRIATHYWRHAEAKGTVMLVHGLFDHAGLFQPLVRKILSEGFSVLAIDLPGHGLSDGEPTVINSFFDYAAVLDDCIEGLSDTIQRPLVGVGQSTGAAALMAQVFSAKSSSSVAPYERLVLLAPLVRSRSWWTSVLAYKCLHYFLSELGRKFTENTHDESFNHFLSHSDILQSRKLSVRWVGALMEWASAFSAQPASDIPLLIIQGTNDRVVDWQYNTQAIEKKFPQSTLIAIEGAMHHLANEGPPWREAVDEQLFSFLHR